MLQPKAETQWRMHYRRQLDGGIYKGWKLKKAIEGPEPRRKRCLLRLILWENELVTARIP